MNGCDDFFLQDTIYTKKSDKCPYQLVPATDLGRREQDWSGEEMSPWY